MSALSFLEIFELLGWWLTGYSFSIFPSLHLISIKGKDVVCGHSWIFTFGCPFFFFPHLQKCIPIYSITWWNKQVLKDIQSDCYSDSHLHGWEGRWQGRRDEKYTNNEQNQWKLGASAFLTRSGQQVNEYNTPKIDQAWSGYLKANKSVGQSKFRSKPEGKF